jgi:EAL domain-containing protein (putative c-di-GMP-specific phosphodiesterase class I)
MMPMSLMPLVPGALGWMQSAGSAAERRVQRLPDVARVIHERRFHVHFQPIVALKDRQPVGYEALSRFPDQPVRGPDQWWLDAYRLGMHGALEFAQAREALTVLDRLPAGRYVSVNMSPSALLGGGLARLFEGLPLQRIVLELTEQTTVADYEGVNAALLPLRREGLRVAVDDAGAGYASFRHVLKLKPDVIKLDASLIRDIANDRDGRALAAALVGFAREIECAVVAEGVETEAQVAVLDALGVTHCQGYFFGRPAPLD